jgi:transposase
MKKRKKNIERALGLKSNILKYNNLINLPQKNNIQFNDDNIHYNPNTNKFQSSLINGIKVSKFNSKIINDNKKFKLQSDNLIEDRPLKDILIKTYKVLLKPNDKQKKSLFAWMDSWIDMYNKVLFIIKKERKTQSEKANKSLQYNEMSLDNLEINKLKKDLKQFKDELNKKTQINLHTLDYCINDVLTMLKSSISNLKSKNFKKSKLRYIKKTKKSKIFKIENFGSITENSFCTSVFGKHLKSNPSINYKKANSSLTTIQYKDNKFYMLIKKKLVIQQHSIKKQKIISLDGGHRTFLSGLSNNHLIEIGDKVDKKIKKKLIKMDKIKARKARHKRKHLLKHEKDLSNYINNLHWQTINYLTTNYNHVLLGNYSTKEMVENDKTNKMNKRIGSSLKFFQFRTKLKYKCLIRGCKFGLIDEYNTTKACSNCSTLNNIGSSKEYKCKHCEHLYPRDINSTKNILLKSIIN